MSKNKYKLEALRGRVFNPHYYSNGANSNMTSMQQISAKSIDLPMGFSHASHVTFQSKMPVYYIADSYGSSVYTSCPLWTCCRQSAVHT